MVQPADNESDNPEWNHPSRTMIVFDWDDTLCPSTWIEENRPALSYFKRPTERRFLAPLQELETSLVQLLECAQSLGEVVIITNAKKGWVEKSMNIFFPKASELLNDVPTIYAREIWNSYLSNHYWRKLADVMPVPDMFKKKEIFDVNALIQNGRAERCSDGGIRGDQFAWKTLAFATQLSKFYCTKDGMQSWSNVISIGDSDHEMVAMKDSMKFCSPITEKRRAKTIKMIDAPTISELIVQVNQVAMYLPRVVKHHSSIDFAVSPED